MSMAQQTALALCLFICVFVVIPRLFLGPGGGKEAAARSMGAAHRPPGPGRGQPLNANSQSKSPKGPPNLRMTQMRSVIQKEANGEKTQGRNKGFAFQLMPLYVIGIGVYAVYKLVQIKFNENEKLSNKKNKEVDKKKKNTENQLSELEIRLSQTERMLDSLVKELDPLTSCVDAVAFEQKSEIMTQLQQIRQLMKERQPSNIDEELVPVSENLEEFVQDIEIKTQLSESQAFADNEEELLEDIDPITGKVTASAFCDETESVHSISTEDSEGDSEAFGDLSETRRPMELRRRNKMYEF